MSPLAVWILALLVQAAPPGRTVYSFEPMPECGTSREAPTCPLERVCSDPSPMCAPPRWSESRGAWVRVETREAALRRYRAIAEADVRAATWLTRCKAVDGSVVEDCKPAGWAGGPRSLAAALATVAIWESGLREDIQGGYAPAGRGPSQEGCLVQVMPDQAAQNELWLPAAERTRLASTRAGNEEAIQNLLGEKNLERCFEAGGRILARARAGASARCRGMAWSYSMFSFYGTGGTCSPAASGDLGDWAGKRQRTFERFLATRTPPPLPEWARALEEPAEVAAEVSSR